MTLTYRAAIAGCMHSALEEKKNSVIFGLGVTDSIGIFGTTKDLHVKFGAARVFDTPICEESSMGFALGLSLSGHYPISVHIRNDFLLLACNQIVNSIAKYRSMFGGRFTAPMLIRAVIGRSWGQGAQHSQSLQSLFAHVPGLTVIMPSSAYSLRSSYEEAFHHYPGPVLSLEHRFLYDYEYNPEKGCGLRDSRIVRKGHDLTIVATSYLVQELQKVMPILTDSFGIDPELIDLHSISHPAREKVLDSVKKTGRLVVADTSWAPFGVVAEVCRWISEREPALLRSPVRTLHLAHTPCPTAHTLENFYYPSLERILRACWEAMHGQKAMPGIPPDTQLTKLSKKFRGPF